MYLLAIANISLWILFNPDRMKVGVCDDWELEI